MKTYAITLGIINHNNKYLIAKRAETKNFSPGQWEFISGFIDTKDSAEEIILRELQEELGVKGRILESGNVYSVTDAEARWIIVPFLVGVEIDQINLNTNDHSEFKWVLATELDSYKDLPDVQILRKMNLID